MSTRRLGLQVASPGPWLTRLAELGPPARLASPRHELSHTCLTSPHDEARRLQGYSRSPRRLEGADSPRLRRVKGSTRSRRLITCAQNSRLASGERREATQLVSRLVLISDTKCIDRIDLSAFC